MLQMLIVSKIDVKMLVNNVTIFYYLHVCMDCCDANGHVWYLVYVFVDGPAPTAPQQCAHNQPRGRRRRVKVTVDLYLSVKPRGGSCLLEKWRYMYHRVKSTTLCHESNNNTGTQLAGIYDLYNIIDCMRVVSGSSRCVVSRLSILVQSEKFVEALSCKLRAGYGGEGPRERHTR